jgi:hypothetical protein
MSNYKKEREINQKKKEKLTVKANRSYGSQAHKGHIKRRFFFPASTRT